MALETEGAKLGSEESDIGMSFGLGPLVRKN